MTTEDGRALFRTQEAGELDRQFFLAVFLE